MKIKIDKNYLKLRKILDRTVWIWLGILALLVLIKWIIEDEQDISKIIYYLSFLWFGLLFLYLIYIGLYAVIKGIILVRLGRFYHGVIARIIGVLCLLVSWFTLKYMLIK